MGESDERRFESQGSYERSWFSLMVHFARSLVVANDSIHPRLLSLHRFRAVILPKVEVFLPNTLTLQAPNRPFRETLAILLKQAKRTTGKKSPPFSKKIPAKIGIARKYHCKRSLPDCLR